MAFTLPPLSFTSPFTCRATLNSSSSSSLSPSSLAFDSAYIKRAAELADKSAGFTAPHPNFGCVIATTAGGGERVVVGEGYLYAQGTTPAEMQAVEAAGERCLGATAYLNMEPNHCLGDETAVSALVQAGIGRVVIGMRHPLQHLRGKAVHALKGEGLLVDVLGEDIQSKTIEEGLKSCLLVNAPLLYRAACRVPFSILKYAMTLDDPRLTARHGGGHLPQRIVMSTSLDLPEVAHLWDVTEVPTMVATQRGAKRSFQKFLASKGVEVVEFEILNPKVVTEYLYDRGCLSVLWECGGTLSAAAISSGVVHKVHAFVAPKIIGGKNAPSPVGELGMVEMSQALELNDVHYEQVGPDMLVSGFLHPVPDLTPVIPSVDETFAIDPTVSPYEASIIFFYKTWDPYGAFSNFSLHPIQMPDENGDCYSWPSVEHYYQAHKFVDLDDPVAKKCLEEIKNAKSPEEAARLGRTTQRQRPDLVRSDWDSVKTDIMYRALKCKFSTYPNLTSMLLSTTGSVLVEASPHDLFWGGGRDGEGLNYLGRLLMQLRSEFLAENADRKNRHREEENEVQKLA
ncbi:riboflavin biosynthesis protein pyrr chloroplastic [Phtheirospermum japonicum]|uniref:Riboflavin biosynthesis protein pyrr chloroplastic n=1 Tax=Phtheirospermum japonicum TaxID=374723 RepID=A0A830CKQ3_9LAMI|nr:riboflavin biosynthesis protein pyrr chloroplastic [Phtheirospermum japonicum]